MGHFLILVVILKIDARKGSSMSRFFPSFFFVLFVCFVIFSKGEGGRKWMEEGERQI